MAKLNKKLAAAAREEADNWSDRSVLPSGLYLCRLRSVDTSKSGAAGPYWVWEYETVEAGDQPVGRRFWDNTSLSEKAIGRLGKVFAAFGASTEADTDDLCGQLVTLDVRVGTIQKGERAGEKRNEVAAVLTADSFPDYDPSEFKSAEAADPDDFA
jgi:hypothetical protein